MRKKIRYAADMSEDEKRLIVGAYQAGTTTAAIAKEYGSTTDVVQGIIKNAASYPSRITIRKFSWEGSHA